MGIIFYISTLLVFVALIPILPVPDFLLNMQSYTMPSEVMYFLEPFKFDLGLGIIVAAYSFRFIRKVLIKA
jgi:hypothetical protein